MTMKDLKDYTDCIVQVFEVDGDHDWLGTFPMKHLPNQFRNRKVIRFEPIRGDHMDMLTVFVEGGDVP